MSVGPGAYLAVGATLVASLGNGLAIVRALRRPTQDKLRDLGRDMRELTVKVQRHLDEHQGQERPGRRGIWP